MADDYTTPVSTTGYVYDELNRLVLVDEEPDPNNNEGQTKYAYDKVGNRSVVVYPNGTCTAYAYDNLNRLTGMVNRTYEGGGLTVCPESGALLSQFDYTLGAAGNRTQVDELVLEADGTLRKRTVKYEYDNLYRLTKETVIDDTDLPGINPDPQVRTVRSFTYDRVGNRLTEQFVTSTDTTTYGYTYDDQGMDRLTNKTQSVSVVSNIGPEDLPHYAGAAPVPSRWAGRGFLGYVALTMVSLFAPLALLGFRTRRLGRRQARRRRRRAAVAAVLIPLLVVGPEHVFALYQEAMARRAMSEALTAAVLAQTGGEVTWTYGYDNNGDMVLRTDGAHVDLYHYDAENRLRRVEEIADVNVDPTPVPTVSYEYDADGVRKSKAELDPDTGDVTSVTTYLTDKNRPYAQVLMESKSVDLESPATVDATYTYGDDLISQTRSGAESYYLYDGQMSVRQLTDAPADPQTAPAVVTDSYTFEAFGTLSASTFDEPNGPTTNNYLYTGEQYDPNVGFYYLRARYYDQAVGRFTSRDPYESQVADPGTLHRYLYVGANPLDRVDPSGLFFTYIGQLVVAKIQAFLEKLNQSTLVRKVLRPLFWNKKYELYIVSEPVGAGVPSHWFVFLVHKDRQIGFRFDVGLAHTGLLKWAAGGIARYFRVLSGQFFVTPYTRREMAESSLWSLRVASFTRGQRALWLLTVIPLGFANQTARIMYSIPGYPFTINCYTWTAEAVAAGAAIQFIPLK